MNRKSFTVVSNRDLCAVVEDSDAFICAAGFEKRARVVPLAGVRPRLPLIIRFVNGVSENEKTFRQFHRKFSVTDSFDFCELDWNHVEKFEISFSDAISKWSIPNGGRIVVDISGLPNFAICLVIALLRTSFPFARITVLYTEAEEYFPRHCDYKRIKEASSKSRSFVGFDSLSARAVNLFLPRAFSGVALGHNDTCLIVFAGYEPHRTHCAIEAMNPSKLVMVYGEPGRQDLKWRLDLSRIMHSSIDLQLMKTEETAPTGGVGANFDLILEYYKWLYDDHILCVCPGNSKIQALASVLAWEVFPDIQLAFPIPAVYLPKRFSVEFRDTFVCDLGFSNLGERFVG